MFRHSHGWDENLEDEWVSLGKGTQIIATREPLSVHSHSPTADAKCSEGQKHLIFLFLEIFIWIPERNLGMLVCKMEVTMSLYHPSHFCW